MNNNQNMMNMLINQAVQRDPRLSQNPRAMEIINVLRNHDTARGQEIANNLVSAYNMTPDQGVQTAKSFFGVN